MLKSTLFSISLAGFALNIFCADSSVSIKINLGEQKEFKIYEKIEFKLDLIKTFANPFDSGEEEVYLEIKKPDGKSVKLPAFYMQKFEFAMRPREGRNYEWLYPDGNPGWFARYVCDVEGEYSASAIYKSATGFTRSEPIKFKCAGGRNDGFVRVSRDNPLYFEFDSGKPFFPIGLNLAFVGFGQYLDFNRLTNIFAKMQQNGANYARIWVCCEDWAIGVEARKSAFSRSYSWNPPYASPPGNENYHSDKIAVQIGGDRSADLTINPSEPVALKPNRKYVFSGKCMGDGGEIIIEFSGRLTNETINLKKNIWVSFSRDIETSSNQWWLDNIRLRSKDGKKIFIKDISLREYSNKTGTSSNQYLSNYNFLWEADPNRALRGVFNQTDCALLDYIIESAEKYGIYLQLCLLTRDHYRLDLINPDSAEYVKATKAAQNFMKYAVARWGYSPNVAVWEYFNEMDPNAPTIQFHKEVGEYLESVDIFKHLRSTSGWGPAPNHWIHPKLDFADLHWYLREAWGPLWKDETMAVFDRAELLRKYATNKPAILGEIGLATDRWGKSNYMDQDKDGIHIHNILWASLFSGLSGTALFWWWDTFDPMNQYHHFKPLSQFVSDIPFNKIKFKFETIKTSNPEITVFSMVSSNSAYLWVREKTITWWNCAVERANIAKIKNAQFKLTGIEKGKYRVEWFDTYDGKVISSLNAVCEDSGLELYPPEFIKDLACKVVKQ